MRKFVFALCLIFLASGSAAASDQADVMKVVQQFFDGINKGDAAMTVATCADDAVMIDEFPPHEWHGSGACAKWWSDYDADAKKNGITDGVVSLGKPRHVDVTGDRAYVVVPASYSLKQNGKPVKEINAAFTVALKKANGGWLIAGWSWSKP